MKTALAQLCLYGQHGRMCEENYFAAYNISLAYLFETRQLVKREA